MDTYFVTHIETNKGNRPKVFHSKTFRFNSQFRIFVI